MAEHLADFAKTLVNTNLRYQRYTVNRIRCVLDACGFQNIHAIERERVEEVLREIQAKHSLGPNTYNHYLQAVSSFCIWLVDKAKRLSTNPMRGAQFQNKAIDCSQTAPRLGSPGNREAARGCTNHQCQNRGLRWRSPGTGLPFLLFDRASPQGNGKPHAAKLRPSFRQTDADHRCQLVQASQERRPSSPSGARCGLTRLDEVARARRSIIPATRSTKDLEDDQARPENCRDPVSNERGVCGFSRVGEALTYYRPSPKRSIAC